MKKNLSLLQPLLYILLSIFLLIIAEMQVFSILHKSSTPNEIFIFHIVNFSILIFWLLSLVTFYRFSLSIYKIKLTRQEDRIQLEESEKLIQTLRSQRHDYRNQLQVIRVLAQFNKTEEIDKYIDDYVSMGNITADVPERIENSAISAMLLVYATEAKDKGIEMVIDSDINFNQFRYSPAKITRILGNIIRNALEVLEKSPRLERTIKVTMWETNTEYTFLIWNNGPEIPKSFGNSIFSPGFSAKNSTGLGLYIVKTLVSELQGKIIWNSSAEEGTEFRINLPLIYS